MKKGLIQTNYRSYLLFAFYSLPFICLLIIFLTSLNNTPSGDDFAFSTLYRQNGVIEAAYNFYMTYTARISNLLVIGILYKYVNIQALAIVGALANIIVLFTSSLLLLAKNSITSKLGAELYWIVAILCLSLLTANKTIYENTYWLPGIVTYSLPVVGTILYFYFRSKNNTVKRRAVLLSSLFFIAFINEAWTLQLVSVAVIYIIMRYILSRKLDLFLVMETSVLMIGMALMVLSPGTQKRAELYSETHTNEFSSIFEILTFVVRFSVKSVLDVVSNSPHLVIMVILAGILSAKYIQIYQSSKRSNIIFFLFSISMCFLGFAVLATIFGMAGSRTVTGYSLYTPLAQFIIALFLIGHVIGKMLISKVAMYGKMTIVLSGFILLISGLPLTLNRLNVRMTLQKFEYKNMTEQIQVQKNQNNTDIVLSETTRYFSYCVPTENINSWCNEALSKYYEVNSIKSLKYEEVLDDDQIYKLDKLE